MGWVLGLGVGLKAAYGGSTKLHTIVAHKRSISCGIFGLCFTAWFMRLGMGLGLGWGCIWFWFWGWVGTQLELVLFEDGLLIGGRGNPCATLALSSLTTDQ